MGSQRLKRKNLREINGVPLITLAIRKCRQAECFDEVWVNSEADVFGEIAKAEGVYFHKRPTKLSDNQATSEDFVFEFMQAHTSDYLFQVHTIAPLLTVDEMRAFVRAMLEGDYDVLLSVVSEQIECVMDGKPLNFSIDRKTNSQELIPIQRLTWSITGWLVATFIQARGAGKCATYAGKIGYHSLSRISGHVIKTEADLRLAQAMLI